MYHVINHHTMETLRTFNTYEAALAYGRDIHRETGDILGIYSLTEFMCAIYPDAYKRL